MNSKYYGNMPQNYNNNLPYNYNNNNYNDDRLIAGGFAFPFLLGGVTGAALAPAFWRPGYGYNRPVPYNYYPPYYGPYPRYY
ncbi:MAG: hypothetical protein V8Q75_01360 [Bacilli bacterium]